MAKKGLIENNKKIASCVEKYKEKKEALFSSLDKSDRQKNFEVFQKLAAIPRMASAKRHRLRCSLTGRSRGNFRKFGLSRNKLREMVSFGLIPGFRKSSW